MVSKIISRQRLLSILALFATLFLFSCEGTKEYNKKKILQNHHFKSFDLPEPIEVLIVGTYHFAQEAAYDELSSDNQKELELLTEKLSVFRPSKVYIEKDPVHDSLYNASYRKYVESESYISDKANELFQLGYRMAKKMKHDSIYLFDNKPDFIGSLEGFTFESFGKYSDTFDVVFNKKYHSQIFEIYPHNDSIRNSLSLYENIKSLNSPHARGYDVYRMHSVEARVGINDTWIGPDWLGRWYQRNIRMMMQILRQSFPGDKVIVFVGSNHKWVLEQLMHNTPDFKVVDPNLYL